MPEIFAARLILPPRITAAQVHARILASDGDSTRDITSGEPSIDQDGLLTASYLPPAHTATILLRLAYPGEPSGPDGPGPGGPSRIWLTAPEPGRSTIKLPDGPPPTAPGEAALSLLPSTDGFRFVNHFESSPLPAIENGLGIHLNAYGLCGGMSFAAADLFLSHRPRPDATTPPPAGSPLYDYIYRRQTESLGGLAVEGLRFAQWMALPEGTIAGTNRRTYDQLAAARAALDSGHLAVLGLVYVGDKDREPVWNNHQVLAFGYRADGESTSLRIYDPNYPGRDDVTIRATPTTVGAIDAPELPGGRLELPGIACRQFVGRRDLRPVRGFFVMPYSPAVPPTDLSTTISPAPQPH